MNFRMFILIILSFFLSNCSSNGTVKVKNLNNPSNQLQIGFGSCLDQSKPMPILRSIVSEEFNLFLMLGDNIYGSSKKGEIKKIESAYEIQAQNFKKFGFDMHFEAIWDDHDYGLNDGGKEYLLREKSKELFLEFWEIPKDDPRRSRKGLYHDFTINSGSKKIQLIFLDTRTFRDKLKPTDSKGKPGKERYIPNNDSSFTMLGFDQWQWLIKKLSETTDYRIIISSIQFVAVGHGWESWKNLPHERNKLIDLIDNSVIKNTLVLSGDRHRGGIYQLITKNGNIISEVTSSSLNASYSNPEEAGPLRIGKTFVEENYGAMYFNDKSDTLSVFLKNIIGEELASIKVGSL